MIHYDDAMVWCNSKLQTAQEPSGNSADTTTAISDSSNTFKASFETSSSSSAVPISNSNIFNSSNDHQQKSSTVRSNSLKSGSNFSKPPNLPTSVRSNSLKSLPGRLPGSSGPKYLPHTFAKSNCSYPLKSLLSGSAPLRLPLWDKQSDEYCFAKSRDLLSKEQFQFQESGAREENVPNVFHEANNKTPTNERHAFSSNSVPSNEPVEGNVRSIANVFNKCKVNVTQTLKDCGNVVNNQQNECSQYNSKDNAASNAFYNQAACRTQESKDKEPSHVMCGKSAKQPKHVRFDIKNGNEEKSEKQGKNEEEKFEERLKIEQAKFEERGRMEQAKLLAQGCNVQANADGHTAEKVEEEKSEKRTDFDGEEKIVSMKVEKACVRISVAQEVLKVKVAAISDIKDSRPLWWQVNRPFNRDHSPPPSTSFLNSLSPDAPVRNICGESKVPIHMVAPLVKFIDADEPNVDSSQMGRLCPSDLTFSSSNNSSLVDLDEYPEFADEFIGLSKN